MRHQGVREVHSSRNLKADWELGLKKVLGREGMACEKALTEAGEGLGIKEKDTWVGMGAGMWLKIRLSGWQGPDMQARELSSLGRRVRGKDVV